MHFNGFSYMNGSSLMVAVGLLALVLVLYVLQVIGLWLTLQKMGRHDFAALVPGYDLWELSRGAGFRSGAAVVLIVLFAMRALSSRYVASFASVSISSNLVANVRGGFDVLSTFSALSNDLGNRIWAGIASGDMLLIASLAVTIVYLVFYLYLYYGVAKSFGHGVGYTLGLIVIPVVFFLVLGASAKQRYVGPMLDKRYRERPRDDWAQLVSARIGVFGSNAPLALAVMGLLLGAFLMPLPGIVLSIIALVRNSKEGEKPLARAKCRATVITAIMGIAVSILAIMVATAMVLSFADFARLGFGGFSAQTLF